MIDIQSTQRHPLGNADLTSGHASGLHPKHFRILHKVDGTDPQASRKLRSENKSRVPFIQACQEHRMKRNSDLIER